jgi:DNA-binding transcriptional regulator YdaS (Cro superfamily)
MHRAIERAGGTKPLAIALGITPEAIYVWDRVPVLRVLDVERITGVPRHELRPDIYPPPDSDRQSEGQGATVS